VAVSGSVGSGNANLDEAIENLAANIATGGIGAAAGSGAGAATRGRRSHRIFGSRY